VSISGDFAMVLPPSHVAGRKAVKPFTSIRIRAAIAYAICPIWDSRLLRRIGPGRRTPLDAKDDQI
jgi:hypothetical protein